MGKARIVILAAGLIVSAAAWADDDHERAREALERGDILPLTEIMARVSDQHPGQILAAEFDREWFGYRYELELLDEDGYMLEVEVDAATGEILEVEREDD
jgi:uncharacterized membrane protein YkoI